MQTEWGRDERTGRPSSLPIYTLTLLAFAMATVIGVSCVRYIRVWTPLQRHYLPAYLGGQIAGTFRANGWYTLLQVVTQKGSRVALDSDVMPAMSEGGQLNQAIRYAMQDSGQIAYGEYGMKVLVARQEITAADRQWAAQYESGNVVRYAKGSKTVGTEAGDYARVEGIDEKQNLVIVGRANGQRVSYDPRRLQGVTLYREMEREFSEGDRVQFTAPDREATYR